MLLEGGGLVGDTYTYKPLNTITLIQGGLIMSDHTIKETYASLKLIRRVDTLGRDIEQLIMAAYQYP